MTTALASAPSKIAARKRASNARPIPASGVGSS